MKATGKKRIEASEKWMAAKNRAESIRRLTLDQDANVLKARQLLEDAKTAPSEAERKELYRKVIQLTIDDMGQVPLVNGWLLIAHTNKLKNYKPMRTGFLKTLKDAYLES